MPILIHEPDELVTVAISEVQCVPEVLAISAGTAGVWGLAPRDAGMLILIDFYKNKRFQQLTGREAYEAQNRTYLRGEKNE